MARRSPSTKAFLGGVRSCSSGSTLQKCLPPKTVGAATGVTLVVVIAGAIWGWRAWQASTVPSYITDRVTREDLTVSLVATGTVEPTHLIGVSSLINGTILSVDVTYNDAVKVGQPLAHIDPVDYEAKRRHA